MVKGRIKFKNLQSLRPVLFFALLFFQIILIQTISVYAQSAINDRISSASNNFNNSIAPNTPKPNNVYNTAKASAALQSVSLNDALRLLNAVFEWDPFFMSAVIKCGPHSATFRTGDAGKNTLVLFDNKSLYNLPTPFMQNGELCFPNMFVNALASIFKEAIQNDATRFRIAAIIVDPGHGGKDPGASTKKNINGKNVSIIEKDIVLDVSKELFRKLKRTFPDKQLIMTRAGDTYPSLKERSDKANAVPLKQNEAIIFVSVHANSSTNKDANGFEVWYLDPNVRRDVLDKKIINEPNEVIPIINDMLQEQFTTESILLSQMIAGEFQNTFGNSLPLRGILSKDWYVVKNSRMPAVLVELGFISNEKDAFLMLNQSQKFADAIFKGINDFVTRFESSEGFTAR